jgi:MscS family membrane protein
VLSFLEAYRSKNYTRAAKYLDLRKLSPQRLPKDGPILAEQLGQILERDARFEIAALSREPAGEATDGLPANRERVESFSIAGQTLDLEMERVSLRSRSPIWLFSADSVDRIPKLARLTSDSPVEKHLPDPLLTWKFLDTSLWRWIALVLLAAALAAISKLFSRSAVSFAEPALKRLAPRLHWSAFEVLVPPLRLLLAAAVFRAGMEWIGPSARLRPYLEKALTFLFFYGLAWLSMRIVDLAIDRVRGILQAKHHTFSYSALPLASRVVKITILMLTVAAVLSNWGYNTTAILTGLGVGGIAIALAAQKTIENFFGGVAVISDRPVNVGDSCRFGDRVGAVEDIGLRSTRLRTPDRTLVSVPNAQFSAMTLENFDRRDKMLFHLILNLRRETSPDQVRTLLASISGILTKHPKVEAGALPVRFIGVGTYSLDLEVFAYVLTLAGDEFLQIQQDLLLRILDAVEAAGTALALPTQASITYSLENAAKPNGKRSPREVAPVNGN